MFVGTVFLLCVLLFISVFFLAGIPGGSVDYERDFYFLTKECETSDVSVTVGNVYLSGGAGYILTDGNKELVALACYPDSDVAQKICDDLTRKGNEVRILQKSAEKWTIRGKKALSAEGMTNCCLKLDECERKLYASANSLEKGELTQSQAKLCLVGVISALGGARREEFPKWSKRLDEIILRARECAEGIVLSKDVRYLQIALADMLIRAKEYLL